MCNVVLRLMVDWLLVFPLDEVLIWVLRFRNLICSIDAHFGSAR